MHRLAVSLSLSLSASRPLCACANSSRDLIMNIAGINKTKCLVDCIQRLLVHCLHWFVSRCYLLSLTRIRARFTGTTEPPLLHRSTQTTLKSILNLKYNFGWPSWSNFGENFVYIQLILGPRWSWIYVNFTIKVSVWRDSASPRLPINANKGANAKNIGMVCVQIVV